MNRESWRILHDFAFSRDFIPYPYPDTNISLFERRCEVFALAHKHKKRDADHYILADAETGELVAMFEPMGERKPGRAAFVYQIRPLIHDVPMTGLGYSDEFFASYATGGGGFDIQTYPSEITRLYRLQERG